MVHIFIFSEPCEGNPDFINTNMILSVIEGYAMNCNKCLAASHTLGMSHSTDDIAVRPSASGSPRRDHGALQLDRES